MVKILTVMPLKVGTYAMGQGMVSAFEQIETVQQEVFYSEKFPTEAENLDNLRTEISLAFLEQVKRFAPDLIFVVSYSTVPAEALAVASQMGVRIASWILDDYRYRNAHALALSWDTLLKVSDLFFSFQSGGFIEALQQKFPDKHIEFMPPAYNPEHFQPLSLDAKTAEQYASPVMFCAAPYPNRVRIMNQICDSRFALWGGWSQSADNAYSSVPLSENTFRQVPEDCFWVEPPLENVLYNSADICLNIHSSLTEDLLVPQGDNLNPRVFCIAGAAGFQLVDHRDVLASVFEPGEELVSFQSLEQLQELIDYYLAHPDQRQKIARQGHQRAASEHQYKHRALRVLEVF